MSDQSIYQEINELKVKCQELDQSHRDAMNTFELLHEKLNDSIMVTYQNEKQDFKNVLEAVHSKMMEDIQKGKQVCFGSLLVETLNQCDF